MASCCSLLRVWGEERLNGGEENALGYGIRIRKDCEQGLGKILR